MSDLDSSIYIENNGCNINIIKSLYEKYCCMCCGGRQKQNIKRNISYTFELNSDDEF
jgi:hypothetical protein